MNPKKNKKSQRKPLPSLDYCPICNKTVTDYNKHVCEKDILEEIDEQEEEEIDFEDERSYGDRLDEADFILNYYDSDDEEEKEEDYYEGYTENYL